jgi:tartronate-semialdehyde synthase
MSTIEAAVHILKIEGFTAAFGVPGAAINPLYAAMKKLGGIQHYLARHVEGASHMAEGYSRAAAGNIGLCIGTSGPAGTDMITGLYSASADSVPILCLTGQAPRDKLDKEDFQAVDIAAIAKPLTKMAITVMEPARLPSIFQKAMYLMRSDRPGPVLIDLPIDVQMAQIDFEPDNYQPLPPSKPAAPRALAEKALDMLATAERPVIVAGGGIINADASDLLVAFAELVNVPVIPTLMGLGTRSACRPTTATAMPPTCAQTSSSVSAIAGPTGTPARSRPIPRGAPLSTSISSRCRSAGFLPRTWGSSPTPAPPCTASSRWPRSAGPPACCRTARLGSPNVSIARKICFAEPTMTRCR